ncbi:MAG TPA: FAD-dependent oxidoreductase [Bryobacteraceae bacterium]|nr:FAD-dependent oxidoreductase [Bryobacteraceae bacterium]
MAAQTPDVIIVGAGIVGGSIAWRLAQAGIAVTLLDAGTLGGEASWAGAGMLAPGGEFVTRSHWADFALESLRIYPRFVAELQDESGLPIDYRPCGALEFARSDAEWQELRARIAQQEPLGIRAEMRDGGLFYPGDALVDPRDITRALRCVCGQRGVRISEQTRVLAVKLAGGRVDLETSGGPMSAAAAVLSAGAWSGQVPVAGIQIPATFPVRGHLLGYALEPGSLGPILRHGHTYVMQRSNGFTIAGTSSEQVGFNREIDPLIVASIHARACDLLPRLRSAPEPAAWLGFRPATESFVPCIGRLHDTRLWLAYGHYRNGILLAPATADRISGQITSSLGTDSPAPGGHP